MSDFDMPAAWDRASALYQSRRLPSVDTVSYGALAPTEDELGLLGDLRGRRVLDLGCGGGQNAVACARAGASVTGLDASAVQLEFAHRLAAESNTPVTFVHADAADLQRDVTGKWDLILAIQLLAYADDPLSVLTACRQLLVPTGALVMSIDHPVRDCFLDLDEGELVGFPVRSYDDTSPLRWWFDDGVPMQSRHLPLGEWLGLLRQAGFNVTRLVEPLAPTDLCDELWPEDAPLAPLRLIPHTAILVAHPARN